MKEITIFLVLAEFFLKDKTFKPFKCFKIFNIPYNHKQGKIHSFNVN